MHTPLPMLLEGWSERTTSYPEISKLSSSGKVLESRWVSDQQNQPVKNDQPVRNDLITYENIPKIATGQGDDYTAGCLLDYNYFKKHYKMIAIDLRKQQALDGDPKAMQQNNFTTNLDRAGQAAMYFTIEEAKKKFWICHKELWECCNLILIWYNISIKWLNITF